MKIASAYFAECAKWCAECARPLRKLLILLAPSALRKVSAQSAAKRSKVHHFQWFAGAPGRMRQVPPLRGEAALGARSASRLPPLRFWGREERQYVQAVAWTDTSRERFIKTVVQHG